MSNQSCKIIINGNHCFISGSFNESLVQSICSFQVQGAKYSAAYANGWWSGYKRLYSKGAKSFPAGLLDTVVAALNKYTNNNITIEIEDQRTEPRVSNQGLKVLNGIGFGEGNYDYQLRAAEAFIKAKVGILKLATNAGKTACSAAIIHHLFIPTLFIVPSLDLLMQSSEEIKDYLQLSDKEVGVIGGGSKRFGSWITFSTIDSLVSMKKSKELDQYKDKFDLLVYDECHTMASDTAYDVVNCLTARYRLGMSGTPTFRGDGANIRVIAQCGPICYEVSNEELVKRGVSVRPEVVLYKIDKPILPKSGLTWQEVQTQGIVENEYLNTKIIEECIKSIKANEPCIVIVQLIKHGEILLQKLIDQGYGSISTFISGEKSTKEERQEALDNFRNDEIKCLIGTDILSTGINVKTVKKLIYGSLGKSHIQTLQRSGRGLRISPETGKEKITIVDFIFLNHKWLSNHSMQRISYYREEKCFDIKLGT